MASAAGRPRPAFSTLFRGVRADIEHVRHLSPLPETADELCEVAGASACRRARSCSGTARARRSLKDLSEQGRLAEYGILHFATHGALTGQVQGAAEPGLILTPPAAGTTDARALERDDGYLSASEIAALKLDADWVILSACNTRVPPPAAAMRAARTPRRCRAWRAPSSMRAPARCSSRTGRLDRTRPSSSPPAPSPSSRRGPPSAAPRPCACSMRELIENGTGLEVHPAQWGPFVVVGEGGAQLQTASLPAPSPADASAKSDPPAKEEPAAAPARPKPKATTRKTRSPDWKSDLWGR